jgi:hypothetical protein
VTVKVSFEMEEVDYQNLLMVIQNHFTDQYDKLISPEFNEAQKEWIRDYQKYITTNLLEPLIKGNTK